MAGRVGACNPEPCKSLGSLPFRCYAAPSGSDSDALRGLNRIHRVQGQRASARRARERSDFSHWPEPADILQQKPAHMAQTVGHPALTGDPLRPGGGSRPLAGDARDLVSHQTRKIAGMPRPASEDCHRAFACFRRSGSRFGQVEPLDALAWRSVAGDCKSNRRAPDVPFESEPFTRDGALV